MTDARESDCRRRPVSVDHEYLNVGDQSVDSQARDIVAIEKNVPLQALSEVKARLAWPRTGSVRLNEVR